jgi:8-hydroxy-5-deazaflavin:NADPH oxidoreductase
MAQSYTIGVLGGTGQEGSGLALRWAKAGHNVILGSRDPAKAATAAEQMNVEIGTARVSGASNKKGGGSG